MQEWVVILIDTINMSHSELNLINRHLSETSFWSRNSLLNRQVTSGLNMWKEGGCYQIRAKKLTKRMNLYFNLIVKQQIMGPSHCKIQRLVYVQQMWWHRCQARILRTERSWAQALVEARKSEKKLLVFYWLLWNLWDPPLSICQIAANTQDK